MPSYDEIIGEFRRSQVKEGKDPKQKDTEVMVEGLRDLMEETDPTKIANKAYELLRTHGNPEVGTAIAQVVLSKPDGVKIASDVGKQMTTAYSQKVHEKNGTESFLRGNSSLSNFSKEVITHTSPDYLDAIRRKGEEIAKKYNLDGLDKATPEEREKALIGMAQEMKSFASSTDNLTPDSKKYLQGLNAGVHADTDFVDRYMDSTKVSREEATRLQQKLGEIAINNSAALRFVMSGLSDHPELQKSPFWTAAANVAQKSFNLNDKDKMDIPGSKLHDLVMGGPKGERINELMGETNKLNAQKTELLKKPQTEKIKGEIQKLDLELQRVAQESKLENQKLKLATEGVSSRIAGGVHTEKGRQEVTDMMKGLKEHAPAVGTGIKMESVYNDFTDVREEVMKQRNEIAGKRVGEWQKESKLKAAEQQRGLDKIKPETEKLAALETKLDRLKNGQATLGEKAKAFFKGYGNVEKGLEKEKAQTVDKIDKTKMQMMQKTDPEGFAQLQKQNQESIEKLNVNQGKAVDYAKAGQKVDAVDQTIAVSERLANSGMEKPLSKKETEDLLVQKEMALGEMQINRAGAREFAGNQPEVDNLKKNMKVRDSLRPKEPKVEGMEAPKQKTVVRQGAK